MTTRNLDALFNPSSIAVIGASNRPGAVGAVVMRNLLAGNFNGPIMPVNPRHKAVGGVLCYPDISNVPEVPDLAVICTPPRTIPDLIQSLTSAGTKAAIIITAGLSDVYVDGDRTALEAITEVARKHELRLLGPNCLGALIPKNGLNASFAHLAPKPGHIAFVSQSGALCTTVLDWAVPRGIGFSHVVSLGNAADIDFDDVIDYLGTDTDTRAILLYIESIRERRDFISAARAAARNKPIVIIKAGRAAEGARAATSHTGALAGADDVFDAAIRRAGMLRVHGISELFAAVETLARAKPLSGENLAILTNGGGLGVMAVDDLIDRGGHLAILGKETRENLDGVLPPTWSKANPVDIIGDAPGERYAAAIRILSRAPEVNALLVMHAPTAIVSSTEAAQAVVDVARDSRMNILTSWVGEHAAAPARRMMADAGIPTYDTPDLAVRAFMHMVNYDRNQRELMETPPSTPVGFTPSPNSARAIVRDAIAHGVPILSEIDSKRVLRAYGVNVVETRAAKNPEEAARLAGEIGFPVALKIASPDITHKTDVGGVRLSLESIDGVREAAQHMLQSVAVKEPNARIDGFSVQAMAPWRVSRELIAGVKTDPIFGPVILFGEGGTAVEIIGDRAVALPPLNLSLAKELISRTRVSRLLRAYRDHPAADLDRLALTLVQLSQLVIDIPEIAELDINPLFADDHGVIAVDARIVVTPWEGDETRRLAIRPYPQELEEIVTLATGQLVVIRPIRPEDEPKHFDFLAHLSPEDIRFRFFGLVGKMDHIKMARYTQIDYEREMAFIATVEIAGVVETVGVVRAVLDPDRESSEFAIVVRSDLKGQGLGSRLLDKMIGYVRDRGAKSMVGEVLSENHAMLRLAESLGFRKERVPDDSGVVRVVLPLN